MDPEIFNGSGSIDESAILTDLRSSPNLVSVVNTIKRSVFLTESLIDRRQKMLDELAAILESEGIKGHFRLFGSSVNGLGFIDSDIDACSHHANDENGCESNSHENKS